MGKSSKAPAAPDPYATAAAQGQMNKETAAYQLALNSMDQDTPYGSVRYTQNGTWDNGAPRMTATTTLSDDQKRILDLQTQQQFQYGEIGNTLLGNVANQYSNPLKLGNEAVESRLNELYGKPVAAQQGRDREALDASLYAQGIMPGSEAYARATNQLATQQSDQWNSIYANNRNQAINEQLTEYNAPLSILSAFYGNTQPTQPSFVQTSQAGVQAPDLQGAIERNYQTQLQQHNQNQANKSGALGNILGTIGTIGGWRFSDRRLKANIYKLFQLVDGLNVYSYTYKGQDTLEIGLMADEVEKIIPEAIRIVDGYKQVHYPTVMERI